jgi:hypothetical protein
MEMLNMGAAYMIILVATVACGVNVASRGRDWWVFPKSHTEWEVIQGKLWRVCLSLLNSKWVEYYRMPYGTYLNLVEEIRPYMEKKNTCFREAIPVMKSVAMVLYRLAKGHAPKDVADKFGVSTTTVQNYTHLMCLALADPDKLLRKYIQVPSGDRLRRIIAKFKEVTGGIDNMCGAIDGSHIKLARKPENRYIPAEYWCRHDFHSILLQGVCDADKLFWDVCVRCPGGAYDAFHLRDSDLWRNSRAGQILQQPVINIQDKEIKPYIVGVSSYPLIESLQQQSNGDCRTEFVRQALEKGEGEDREYLWNS